MTNYFMEANMQAVVENQISTARDSIGLQILSQVLGLWFDNPTWVVAQNDEGEDYVHFRDEGGDLSMIIHQDETGEYGVENLGKWSAPDITGSSFGDVGMTLAAEYTKRWLGLAQVASRMLKDGRKALLALPG